MPTGAHRFSFFSARRTTTCAKLRSLRLYVTVVVWRIVSGRSRCWASQCCRDSATVGEEEWRFAGTGNERVENEKESQCWSLCNAAPWMIVPSTGRLTSGRNKLPIVVSPGTLPPSGVDLVVIRHATTESALFVYRQQSTAILRDEEKSMSTFHRAHACDPLQ